MTMPDGVSQPLPSTDGMLTDGWWCHDSLSVLRRVIGTTTRIAVVGSSGTLLHRNKGAEIDEHDIVLLWGDRTEGLPTDLHLLSPRPRGFDADW